MALPFRFSLLWNLIFKASFFSFVILLAANWTLTLCGAALQHQKSICLLDIHTLCFSKANPVSVLVERYISYCFHITYTLDSKSLVRNQISCAGAKFCTALYISMTPTYPCFCLHRRLVWSAYEAGSLHHQRRRELNAGRDAHITTELWVKHQSAVTL